MRKFLKILRGFWAVSVLYCWRSWPCCSSSTSIISVRACHQQAFRFFGHRLPQKIMVDNLKSAVLRRCCGGAATVLRRFIGEPPVLNPRYLDFARHAGFTIVPCNLGKDNEKGRVESGVGYGRKYDS